jgi:pyruvate dehydrogenase E1 component beta subunit
MKTTRVVIVEEGPKTAGWGAEIAASLGSKMSDTLSAPVMRIASPDIPVPFSPRMETTYRPNREDINRAVLKLVD